MAAYYNEIDPYCAAWLRALIHAKLIPEGDVDERPIQDVRPYELTPYTQCHFFAGLGGWPRALGLANFPADRPVWTGSCPCQPFSQAGKGLGFADERHLWPHWHHLIRVCRPAIILGEQVASQPGLAWLDLVQDDLESAAYAVVSADLGAAGVGAPHIRQRLWWCALEQPHGGGRPAWQQAAAPVGHGRPAGPAGGVVANPDRASRWRSGDALTSAGGIAVCPEQTESGRCGSYLANSDPSRSPLGREPQLLEQCAPAERGGWWAVEPDVGRGFDGVSAGVGESRSGSSRKEKVDVNKNDRHHEQQRGKHPDVVQPMPRFLACNFKAAWENGSWENGIPRVSAGVPACVDKLRALGNAIVPQVAAAFIRVVMEFS